MKLFFKHTLNQNTSSNSYLLRDECISDPKNFSIINGFVQFMLQLSELLNSDSEVLGIAFYIFYSYMYQVNNLKFDIYLYGVAALFLSHKLQEQIRSLEDVSACYLYLLEKHNLSIDQELQNLNRIKSFDSNTLKNLQKQSDLNNQIMENYEKQLCNAESDLLRYIGFNFNVATPYHYLNYFQLSITKEKDTLTEIREKDSKTISDLEVTQLIEVTRTFINDSYRYWFCVIDEPSQIFASCLYLALIYFEIDTEHLYIKQKPWYKYFGKDQSLDAIIELSQQISQVFDNVLQSDLGKQSDEIKNLFSSEKKYQSFSSLSNINEQEENSDHPKNPENTLLTSQKQRLLQEKDQIIPNNKECKL